MEWEKPDPTVTYPGESIESERVFTWLNPRDPLKARRRVGEVYWNGWRRLVMSFLLSMFGLTFCVVGVGCMKLCDEFDRGIAFFIIGLITLMPGCYGALTLINYIRCRPGYSYQDLPDFEW